MASNDYLISALTGRDPSSLEVRTLPYSHATLSELLKNRPTALTINRITIGAAEGLLALGKIMLTGSISRERGVKNNARLHYYEKGSDRERVHFVSSISYADLYDRVTEAQRAQPLLGAFVADEGIAEREMAIAIVETFDSAPVRIQVVDGNGAETKNNHALRAINGKMLEQAGGYFTSEQLVKALNSATINPSQFAADLRKTGRIFGVRWGAKDWRYPQFQFDAGKKLASEMPELLKALSPDERGWDRLQWFLSPHDTLQGKTPLEMWNKDRNAVIEAARTERWDARD